MTTHDTFRQAAETNTEPDLLLLEFSDSNGVVVDRAVLNNENVIYDGETYVATDTDINTPSEGEEFKAPSLSFSNISREPGMLVLHAEGRIKVRLIHLDGSDFTVAGGVRTYYTAIQDTKDMLVITDVTADILTISGSLGPKMSLDLPYPLVRTTAKVFPGLYL